MKRWLSFKKKKPKKEDEPKQNESVQVSTTTTKLSHYSQVETKKIVSNRIITRNEVQKTVKNDRTKLPVDSFKRFTPQPPRSALRSSFSTFQSQQLRSPLFEQIDAAPYQINNAGAFPRSNLTVSPRSPTKTSYPPPTKLTSLPPTTRNSRLPPSIKDLSRTIKINVKKNGKYYDQNNKVPTYATHGSKRGSAIIINNVMFEKNKDNRKGAEVDEVNIKQLFEKLGFTVKVHRNLKGEQMKKKLISYAGQSMLRYVDINVVIIMSHGHGTKDGVTKIAGVDDKLLPVSEMLEVFDNNSCPYLANKPKIFILQCCRGSDRQVVETDATPFQIPVEKTVSDMLLAYSTIPGYVSHRNPILGTWYIQAVCKVFMEYACEEHVEDLLKIVEAMLTDLAKESGYTQTSSYENRGFKKCYLHPC